LTAASATFALKAGVWFRRARLLIVAPDSQAPACPLSGRNSTYRPVQICGAGSQGIACDEPQKATRDAKLSKPDYEVWILTCKNATYRIGRYPDMSANVQKLK
jgi:hypothetical protein